MLNKRKQIDAVFKICKVCKKYCSDWRKDAICEYCNSKEFKYVVMIESNNTNENTWNE